MTVSVMLCSSRSCIAVLLADRQTTGWRILPVRSRMMQRIARGAPMYRLGKPAKGGRMLAIAALALGLAWGAPARAADPIKLGFGMALSGGLAGNGKAALLALQLWAEDVNAKGGLLGRKVELVYYDDQSSPAAVPGIYTKLLEVDKLHLLL